MESLKKNIIYWFIIIATVLIVIEGYLFYIVFGYVLIKEEFMWKQTLLELFTVYVGVMMLFAAAVCFYKKVDKLVSAETKKQVKERNVLFANIAHDLKNPMSSVLGFARALEEGNVVEEEKMVIYRTICNKSLQVDSMIQKMFQYAKLESEGYTITKTRTDLAGMVRETVASCYGELEKKDMELEVDIPETPYEYDVDIIEFPRVINNLVINAIKHNEAGTKVFIQMKVNERVQIMIADTGNAIPKNLKESLFEPFQCSDESRVTKDGSGLGLAISKKVVDLHGGKLYISECVKGYTKGFIIEI